MGVTLAMMLSEAETQWWHLGTQLIDTHLLLSEIPGIQSSLPSPKDVIVGFVNGC